MKARTLAILLALPAASLPMLAGCSSTAIAVKEQFGYAKREQLVDNVKSARDSQQAAAQQFESALAEFMAVTNVQGGELEKQYDKLRKAFERSEDRADTVRSRIRDVERVSDALFREWNKELGQYSDASLRAASERQLETTRGQYERLIGSMKAASAKMDPVLGAFKDRVLFLKHNLNAQAIASLQGEVTRIQTDVDALVREMQASIAEANAFIESMQG